MAHADIPTYKSAKRKRKPRLSDKIAFNRLGPPKKSKKPKSPSYGKDSDRYEASPEEEHKRSTAKSLATASAAMSGKGYSGIVKAGLAGAAIGAEIEANQRRFKDRKAKKATTTVSQSAMAQKARYHKKDPTNTKKV